MSKEFEFKYLVHQHFSNVSVVFGNFITAKLQ